MKIVIDINEHIYEQIMADSKVYVLDNEVDRILIENAIYNGTPLPEHHGRLIDADVLEKEMTEYINTLPLAYDEAERIVLLMNHFDDAEIIIEADKGVKNEISD